MSLPLAEPPEDLLDLAQPPPFGDHAARAGKRPASSTKAAVETLTFDADPRFRVQGLCDVYRKLESAEIRDHLKTAARLALGHEVSGLRLLFAFLEVKRPGVEVMKEIENLSSLERVGLKLLSGSWSDPDEGSEPSAALIRSALRNAARLGALGRSRIEDTGDPDLLRQALARLRDWFRRSGAVLDSGRKLPPAMMTLVTEVAELEIVLLERRLSRLATRIDPYDSQGIARVMPVVAFYDQDIQHLKNVVTRLETYRPFHERLLTMEQALSTREIDSIGDALSADEDGRPVAEILKAMRNRPLLEREFSFIVAAVHQVSCRRAMALREEPPDILSTMLRVITHARQDGGIDIALEPELARDAAEGLLESGLAVLTPFGLQVTYRDDRASELVLADGLPRLMKGEFDDKRTGASIRDLVMAQIGNEPFLLGLLENPRITGHPGVISTIVLQARSVRVLTKIASIRRLHTGPSNKDVPRLLLLTAVRIPVNTLKHLIHVRFVSRVDLERLFRSGNDIRSEIRKEIKLYLDHLKK